jgi:hypothetical protein
MESQNGEIPFVMILTVTVPSGFRGLSNAEVEAVPRDVGDVDPAEIGLWLLLQDTIAAITAVTVAR